MKTNTKPQEKIIDTILNVLLNNNQLKEYNTLYNGCEYEYDENLEITLQNDQKIIFRRSFRPKGVRKL